MQMLIVDDERVDREGIAYLLSEMAFPIRYEMAESGEDALEMLRDHRVDVLFTDICMPGIDGLELIRQAKELQPDISSIIYSAYGEFSYAKRAMRFGVKNYILKPIHVDEFRSTIEDMLALYQSRDAARQKDRLVRLLLLEEMEEDDWTVEGNLLLLDLSKALFADRENETLYQQIEKLFEPVAWAPLNELQAVIITPKAEVGLLAEQLAMLTEEQYGCSATLAEGGFITNQKELLEAYHRADDLLDAKFYDRKPLVTHAEPITDEMEGVCVQQLQDLESCTMQEDKVRAINCAGRLFFELEQQGAFSSLYIKYIISSLLQAVSRHYNLDQKVVETYLGKLFFCNDIHTLKDAVVEMLDEIMENENADQSITERVLAIIEQEYMHDISLEEVAERVGLSPSYLSFYFKKDTGKNFIKYLTVYRLEKAKEMLRTTDIKVVTISEMVGYLNSSYFCMLFKNYTGMTPTKYREKETY